MSPTSLTYRSQRLAFAEERGADRLYRLDSAGLEALFNPPSRRLLVRSGAIQQSWTCTRYEPL